MQTLHLTLFAFFAALTVLSGFIGVRAVDPNSRFSESWVGLWGLFQVTPAAFAAITFLQRGLA